MSIYPESFSSRCHKNVHQKKNNFKIFLKIRETEDAAIKVPDLMLLNKGTDRKLELRGGFNTDPKYCHV